MERARGQLQRLRQASLLAVAVTALLLSVVAPLASSQPAVVEENQAAPGVAPTALGNAARDEAIGTLQGLWSGFYANLPKLIVALAAVLVAWLVARALRVLLRRMLGRWERADATITLALIATWLLGIGVAVSVVAGDIRALIGSLGLVGLALSWSLQAPIESFTGWLLNSFRGYYRVGDRIAVGEVFGDVFRIDSLTTTVWEIGGGNRSDAVRAEQPTGRLVTFPNSEILSGTVVNYTGDFPYVWDELSVAVANESDMHVALDVIQRTANAELCSAMREPAQRYAEILRRARLPADVAERPQLFVSMADSWTEITIRYLVDARARRGWKSRLSLAIIDATGRPELREKIVPVYPRRQVQIVDADGRASDPHAPRGE